MHIQHQIKNPGLKTDNVLHVVGVISNTERYQSRYRLAREFIAHMEETPNVQLHMVEAAFGDRHHEIAEAGKGLLLRVNTNAWIKENMINLGVRHLLPQDWKYVAWVDCDVEFRDKYWAQETLHQLQHYAIVQPWQHCADLGPHGSVSQQHESFGSVLQRGAQMQKHAGEPYKYAHSGYAWACTRAFWEQVGGLMDFSILGSGDHHMAWAAIGQVHNSIHNKMSDSYRRLCKEWEQKAIRVSHKEVGYVPGRIEHSFHGPKSRRFYKERWQILVDHQYDPVTDLMRDEQGVLHIVGKPDFERDIRRYNRSRAEDSIEE